jgi:hypothetical protein
MLLSMPQNSEVKADVIMFCGAVFQDLQCLRFLLRVVDRWEALASNVSGLLLLVKCRVREAPGFTSEAMPPFLVLKQYADIVTLLTSP